MKPKTVNKKQERRSLERVVRREFETFREIGPFESGNLTQPEPSCFNGRVSYRKYRVVCELIDEPKEVLEARLRKLWKECTNHHHWQPLQAAAMELGIELTYDERRSA